MALYKVKQTIVVLIVLHCFHNVVCQNHKAFKFVKVMYKTVLLCLFSLDTVYIMSRSIICSFRKLVAHSQQNSF